MGQQGEPEEFEHLILTIIATHHPRVAGQASQGVQSRAWHTGAKNINRIGVIFALLKRNTTNLTLIFL